MGDGVERFDGAFGTAGKIDDERVMADDGDAAREDGSGSLFGSFPSQFLGNARNDALGDIESGFGSIVARAEAGAAGRKDQIDATGVSEFAKLTAKAGSIVGTAERGGDFPAEFSRAVDEGGAGEVFAFTASDGIADGEYGDTHGWRISYICREGKARVRSGVCAKGTEELKEFQQRGHREN